MDFEEYSAIADSTAIYPRRGNNLEYAVLGLCGEVGEVAEKLKKKIRDGTFDQKEFKKELGDVLWYLNAISFELNTSLTDIALLNIEKLEDRQERGKLGGSGDNR